MSKKTKAERSEYAEKLRDLLPRGTTVYTVLTHVSSTGMSRRLKLLIPVTRTREIGLYDAPLKRGTKVEVRPEYFKGFITTGQTRQVGDETVIDVTLPAGVAAVNVDSVRPYKVVKETVIQDITWRAAQVLGWKVNDRHEMTVSGCGMDMGFHAVYELASVLYADDYGKPGFGSGGSNLGGYALNQRWI